MEVIIRIDTKDANYPADYEDLLELNRMGAFPPDAIQIQGGSGIDYVHELRVRGDPARYLLELLALGISGEPRLTEWQAKKAGQTELQL